MEPDYRAKNGAQAKSVFCGLTPFTREVIEKMPKCLGLWQEGVRVDPQRQTGTDPPNGDWVYEPVDQDPFPDYPVTTLSRGTGLTWRHRTRTLNRKRLSDCEGRALCHFMLLGFASRFRLTSRPSLPQEYPHGRIHLTPETAFRRDHAKSDFLSIERRTRVSGCLRG
jgi:hypothetical protein